ncbi:MAG: hypothetical protein IKP86_08100 [Anaerolineaceae bacterium]|nr:hypothetical protein [Anaerolineaceae bacterium]
MYDQIMENLKTDALNDLYSGVVTPLDRDILSDMPLPSDIVDPFASQEVPPLTVMNLTYASLSGWMAESRRESYISERFVYLSKLVMKGVTTMGRGLVTLHNRGEDLSAAPMQIGDLISVGSYHFRKSYLGVVQFASRYPEISERLLVNQLGWSNILLRLYKTKEKLVEEPSKEYNTPEIEAGTEPETIKSEITGPETSGNQLPAGSAFESLDTLFIDSTPAFSSHSSLNEPAAFSAQRAFTSLPGNRSPQTDGKRSAGRNKASGTKTEGSPVTGQQPASAEAPVPSDSEPAEEILPAVETPQHLSEDQASRTAEEDETPQILSDDRPPLTAEEPEAVQIMQNVMERSKDNEDGALSFTTEEMRFLAKDPLFAEMMPELASDIRNALIKYDTG